MFQMHVVDITFCINYITFSSPVSFFQQTSLSLPLESEKFNFSVTAQRRVKLDELINRKQNHSLYKNLSLYYPDTPPPTEFGFKSIKYNQRRNCSLKDDRSDLRIMCSLCAHFVDRNKISFVGNVTFCASRKREI